MRSYLWTLATVGAASYSVYLNLYAHSLPIFLAGSAIFMAISHGYLYYLHRLIEVTEGKIQHKVFYSTTAILFVGLGAMFISFFQSFY